MTQSGQGDRQPREGIVLPADGGEPLIPGAPGNQPAPSAGDPWGGAWGPGAAPQWGSASPDTGGQWGAAPQEPAPGQPMPPSVPGGPLEGTVVSQHQGHGAPPPSGNGGHGAPIPPQDQGAHLLPPAAQGAHLLPPAAQGGHLPPSGALPHAGGEVPHAAPGQAAPAAYGYPQQPTDYSAAPVPGQGYPGAGYGYPQQPAHPQQPAAPGTALPAAAPLQAHGDHADATQYLPPVTGGPGGAPAPVDEGATQYIPPVTPGALPPEAKPEAPAEATQYLGTIPRAASPGPMPGAADAAHPDAQATQYIAPVPAQPTGAPYGIRPGTPEERQPPAEFDSLFRSAPGEEGASSTQQMPRFDPRTHGSPQPQPPQQYEDDGRRRSGRTGSKVPLLAAVGVGVIVIGVGVGALLSGGGDDKKKDDSTPVSAASPTAGGKQSQAADPVKAQAVELDKLLGDSNDSRASVIRAVGSIRTCSNTGQAANDLRAAAKQRAGLVTRLAGLSVDKLPNHAQLTSALNRAWKASASADNHYAAWADQVGRKGGCHKGHARTTPQTAAGNGASGVATQAKSEAADLWNAIAKQYGLTTRDRTQL
ncbi:hypothetical protein ACWCP6_06970 [Streptomyces sp. NPDC002004]